MFKEIKKIKGECPICEDERELLYGIKDDILRINKEDIAVKSKAYYCHEGDHYFSDLEDDEEKFQYAYREYRKRKGLLQPKDISKIREKYKLSQRALSRLLGWGEITVQRYETGALQDLAHNFLLLCIQDINSFKLIFKHRKSDLPERDVINIEKRLKELETKETQLRLDIIFKQAKLKERDESPPREHLSWKDLTNEYMGINDNLHKGKGELARVA